MNTLYKINKHGKLQEWTIETSKDGYRTIAGVTGGKLVTSSWTRVEPKNVGKANETSRREQALKEAKAKWDKKLASGYTENPDSAVESTFVKPMLARTWAKKDGESTKIKNFYTQPKLDGIRCIANKEGLWTRTGKEIKICPHIVKALAPLFKQEPSLILDGELYNHELKDDFNTLTRLTKKYLPELPIQLEYHIYDVPSLKDLPFKKRDPYLIEYANKTGSPVIKFVSSTFTPTPYLDVSLKAALSEGYEGIMLRDPDGKYELGTRSKSLYKYKVFIDREFTILDIVEGKGSRAGKVGHIEFEINGNPFSGTLKGDHAFLTNVLENKEDYIGKRATVRFANYTPGGIPRFPVVVNLDRDSYE